MVGSAHIYEGRPGGEASDHRLIYASFATSAAGPAPGTAIPPRGLMFMAVLVIVVIVTGVIVIAVARRRLRQPPS